MNEKRINDYTKDHEKRMTDPVTFGDMVALSQEHVAKDSFLTDEERATLDKRPRDTAATTANAPPKKATRKRTAPTA